MAAGVRSWFESVWLDVRFAVQTLRTAPLFAVMAIVTLALGIGVNTVMFSAADAVLLNPYSLRHIPDSQRLVMIHQTSNRFSSFLSSRIPARLKDAVRWQRESHSFSQIAWWRSGQSTLRSNGDNRELPERIKNGQASPDLLPMLGVGTQLGRSFQVEDSRPGSPKVAIISDALFRSRFHSDRAVLGSSIRLENDSFRVIGVLSPDAVLPSMMGGFDWVDVQLWLPAPEQLTPAETDQLAWFVYGRLRSNVTLGAATQELTSLQHRAESQDSFLKMFSSISLVPIADEDVGSNLRQMIWFLQASVGLVLLIACTNVANLVLARAVAREKEIAVRLALGAGPLRVLRMMLTESLLLSGCAGMLGLLLSLNGMNIVSAWAPKDTHGLHELRLDLNVLLFTLGVTIVSALLFGVAPFLFTRRTEINTLLSSSSRTATSASSKLRSTLVIAELTLSTVLLIGAGLTMRTVATLLSADLGFQRNSLLVIHLNLPTESFSKTSSIASINNRILDATRRQSYVRNASLSSAVPMRSVQESSYTVDGGRSRPDQLTTADLALVTDGYFETMEAPLLLGRTIQASDRTSGLSSVAVVNKSFALKNWGNENVLGHTIDATGEDGKDAHFRIVGVVADQHQLGPDQSSRPEYFLASRGMRDSYLLIRTPLSSQAVIPTLKSLLLSIHPDLVPQDIHTMNDALNDWIAPRRFLRNALMIFAFFSLVLASIGLYGVLAYSVSLKTREIGVRVALGAEPRAIARQVLRNALILSGVGILLGLGVALALAQVIQSQLYGITATDPLTFGSVAALLLLVTALASYLPARSAASIDPVIALRSE